MSTFKVGHRSAVSISDIANKAQEAELRRFDGNSDGVIDQEEAARFHAAKTLGERPDSIDAALKSVGGRQHEVKTYHQEYWGTMISGVPEWKGDFNIPGLGAGNICTGRSTNSYWGDLGDPRNRQVDAYKFLVNCDLMDKGFVEQGIQSATLMIGPRGFGKEAGSELGEVVAVPLDIAAQDGYTAYQRGGGSTWVPERKYLAAAVDVGDLKKLAGDSGGLSFYVRLETNYGTRYVNRDGKPYNNFDIDAAELA
jgi:hypothetical protein